MGGKEPELLELCPKNTGRDIFPLFHFYDGGEIVTYLFEINNIHKGHSVLVFIHLLTAIIIVIIDYSFI